MQLVSVDVQSVPIMHTENFSSLVSDSGITRYRLSAKVWDMYSVKGDAYQHFPKGIFVERFDSLFHVDGSIKADTAYYFEKKQLWQAIGNVIIRNMEGTTFETSELFWNQKAPANATDAFYTDKFVKITKADSSFMDGINGFKADQSLKSIFLFAGKGNFKVEESPDTLRQNTILPDSIRQHP
jgi:hypothetical protein